MKKLNIFVCENFIPDYRKILEDGKYDDIVIHSYPSICRNKANKKIMHGLLENGLTKGDDGLILSSQSCEILSIVSDLETFKVRIAPYCTSHLANEKTIEHILDKGGYIISSGWLADWRTRISCQGFDKETARMFYKDFCTDLVFFDLGTDRQMKTDLSELSEYLDIPYFVVPYKIAKLEIFLKSIILEWRAHNASQI